MTQQSTKKEYNSFIQGIITEAGPLTFPENASLDEANCVLNRDGSRQRRLGMDFENDFVLRDVSLVSNQAVAAFRWFNVANDTDIQFAVVQVGRRLLVFDANNTPAISAKLVGTIDLTSFSSGTTVFGTASGMGYFFVTTGISTPLYLSYDPVTKVVSATFFTINIRDQFGVQDNLTVNQNPGSLSVAHNYNLLNQGWTQALITQYQGSQGSYPSNTQQWFVGKNSDDNFDPAQLVKQDFGTSPAPRGRFVIDAFARSTSRQAISGLDVADDLETGYPQAVGFAFERVWYAGMQSKYNGASEFNPNYTGYVFYSRTLRGTRDFGQCYSDADPTSEYDSELVETDGGYVNIPESGQIYKLVQKGSSMVVFAEHGIWEIAGGADGFTGVSHQVVKVSEFGVLSSSSVIDAEQVMLYWNRGGIYLLAPDENSGRLVSTNISEKSIQTLFNSISKKAKKHAVGSFDPINRRVQWMYNDEDSYNGVTFKNRYTKELVFDLVLNAFYKNTISSHSEPSPYIAGYLETPDFLLREEGIRTRGDSVTKYLTVQYLDVLAHEAAISFAYYRDPTFRDWKSSDGVGTSFESYLITGYEVMGDSARIKGSPYIIMHFKQTERNTVEVDGEIGVDNPSGCIVQAQWDWANHPDSGKWGEEFQAYRLTRPYVLPDTAGQPINYGYEVVTTKSRLRGSGRSLSLYIRSDEDKDFYLYGWATRFYGKAYV